MNIWVVAALLIGAVAGFAFGFVISKSRSRRAELQRSPTDLLPEEGSVLRSLVWFVGVLYFAAWLLPTVGVGAVHFGSEPPKAPAFMPGWWAFVAAVGPLFSLQHDADCLPTDIMMVATALTNVLFLFVAIRLLVRPSSAIRGATLALICAACLNTYWLFQPDMLLGPGYFLWLASFMLLATVTRIRFKAPRSNGILQPAA